MRTLLFISAAVYVVVLAAGCQVAPSASETVLCQACFSDANCGGNPCFTDVSSNRFCGRPCGGGCPVGYSCQPVQGTGGQVVETCFPDSESCEVQTAPAGSDLSGFTAPDLASSIVAPDLAGLGKRDLAMVPCTPPAGGNVTSSGGTVDRIYFGYTGDTRPQSSSSSYPTSLQTVIDGIYTSMAGRGVEFAMDGGDHMEATSTSDATGNMNSYAKAVALLKKPVFMTMGNHECANSYNKGVSCGSAGAATSDTKMKGYMPALQTISGQSSPYYRFDINTQAGRATFIVVADDAWNDTEQSWLTTQLTDADANSKYTFVSKHHPDGNMDQTYFQTIYDLVKSHKYTLFLTGHSHEYKHQYNDKRAVVMGLGGAPFDNPKQMWYGYLTVMQCPDDSVTVTVYDSGSGMVQDSFNVPPQ
jgi:Calcineurin-like phosphoesterase